MAADPSVTTGVTGATRAVTDDVTNGFAARAGSSPASVPLDDADFRSGEVTRILGISRRQLHYWARTGLVRPFGRTPGGHLRWRFQDLVALKTAKRLIDAGVSVQRIRRSIEALQRTLPTVTRPLAELVLVATGDVVIVLHEGTAFEAATGQEWVFEIAGFRRELERWQAANGRGAEAEPEPVAATARPAATG